MSGQPIGFERWEPGHPWGDVVYADGSKTSVPDPDGSIEAEARSLGSKLNSMAAQPPLAGATPPLTGAASVLPAPEPPPQAPPDAPPPPPPPPLPGNGGSSLGAPTLPTGAPLTAAEKSPLGATPDEIASLGGPPAPTPSTSANPAADVLALHGVAPPAANAPGAPAPAAPGAARNPAEESIRALAPHLLPNAAAITTEGPDAQSKQAIEDVAGEALLQKGQAINQGTQAKALTFQEHATEANDAYFSAWKQRNQLLGDEAALTAARDKSAAELSRAKQTPIRPHADFPEWFVATSILGSLAGGLAEGFSGGRVRNSTLEMLTEITNNFIETQKVNKGDLVADLERQLGDKNAALTATKGKILESLATQADARARTARTKEGMRELGATAAGLRAQALEEYNKTQALLMGKNSTSIRLAAPAGGPGAPVLDNPTTRKLASLGISPDAWTKGLNGKVQAGDTSPTIAQASTATKQIDADIALVNSLIAANGGTLPTTGVVNVPKALIPAMSRLGWKPGMKAEQANQIVQTYLTQKAKSYGGVITESDRNAAALEFGASTEGFVRGLERLRETNNNGIRTALSQQFPGVGQQALDILLTDSSSYSGIPSVAAVPFEKENVTETGPGEPVASDQQKGLKAYPGESEERRLERKATYDANQVGAQAARERSAAEDQASAERKKSNAEFRENPDVAQELARRRFQSSPF